MRKGCKNLINHHCLLFCLITLFELFSYYPPDSWLSDPTVEFRQDEEEEERRAYDGVDLLCVCWWVKKESDREWQRESTTQGVCSPESAGQWQCVCMDALVRLSAGMCGCVHAVRVIRWPLCWLCGVLQVDRVFSSSSTVFNTQGLFPDGQPQTPLAWSAHANLSAAWGLLLCTLPLFQFQRGESYEWGGGWATLTSKLHNQKVNSSARCGVTTSTESYYFYMNDNVQPWDIWACIYSVKLTECGTQDISRWIVELCSNRAETVLSYLHLWEMNDNILWGLLGKDSYSTILSSVFHWFFHGKEIFRTL